MKKRFALLLVSVLIQHGKISYNIYIQACSGRAEN